MNWVASLPIYDFPELANANERFWAVLRDVLIADGIEDAIVPRALGGEGDAIFTQVCGYPLQTTLRGRFALLGTPHYDLPGCVGSTHRAFIVVRDEAPISDLEELRGGRFAVNDLHSNTGMNLPRRLFAEYAREGSFFGDVKLTGSHAASATLVGEGGADAASIDCVTYAFLREYRPRDVARLRILAETPPSPAIPFVTSVDAGPELAARLRAALEHISNDEHFADVRAGLRIEAIASPVESAYDVLLAYERESAALEYPDLR
jgi:ABC-type phosphate/phosphonate transport system substrate-binding protein